MSTARIPSRTEPATGPRDRCREAVLRHRTELIELARDLHAHPEPAFAEHRSAAELTRLLSEHDFTVRAPVAGLDTAFTAERGSGEFVVGICAEYDALPEIGHACGHNLIAAAAVGAALALAEVADELGITVRVIGTPAEETGGGKVLMLERGEFDGLWMAMMVHPGPDDICAPRSLAINDLEVRYTGQEAHAAAAPELGVNAGDALTVAQVAIGLLRQHLEPAQQVHGIVTAGGAAPNIVPAHTAATYNLRAAGSASLERLENRIRACFEAGATATGCTHEVTQVSPVYAELATDERLSEVYRAAVTELGRRPIGRAEAQRRIIGSTDMGNVTRRLPAIHPMNHQAEFAAACASASGDRAVLDGAIAMAWTAITAATEPDHRSALAAARNRPAGKHSEAGAEHGLRAAAERNTSGGVP